MITYRCSLCRQPVTAAGTRAHTEMHRASPDWQHVINYLLIEE